MSTWVMRVEFQLITAHEGAKKPQRNPVETMGKETYDWIYDVCDEDTASQITFHTTTCLQEIWVVNY